MPDALLDQPIPRRRFLRQCSLGAAAPLLSMGCSSSEPRRPPNILFLLSDDQRADALGCAGNPIVETPHIDGLARQGVLFRNNFVTTSICAVSRAPVFTGQYARCHGIHGFGTSLSEEQQRLSYPSLLRQAGYRTGFVGKYGVGRELPREQYDFFQGFAGQGRYFREFEGRQIHLTAVHGDQALGFLEGCSGEQPFCLSVSFKAPHVQDGEAPFFLNDPAYDHLYEDLTVPPFGHSEARDHEALPAFLQGEYEGRIRWERRFSTPERFQESVKRYYRLITGVDAQVGRMLAYLRERGWDDNTVVIYTSDNGFYLGERGLAGKWLMHEESIRTPLIIRAPWLSETARTQRDEMTLNIDLAPTMLSLAGVEIPTSMQGRDVSPLVRGESPAWRKEWFYEHLFEHATIPKVEGVRGERWKYTGYVEADPVYEELYDLAGDSGEDRNLATVGGQRDLIERQRARWRVWRERLESWDGKEPWRDPVFEPVG